MRGRGLCGGGVGAKHWWSSQNEVRASCCLLLLIKPHWCTQP